jgi:predicted negative regulator of RcsB-dependent stress response
MVQIEITMITVGNTEEKGMIERLRYRWEGNIKTILLNEVMWVYTLFNWLRIGLGGKGSS